MKRVKRGRKGKVVRDWRRGCGKERRSGEYLVLFFVDSYSLLVNLSSAQQFVARSCRGCVSRWLRERREVLEVPRGEERERGGRQTSDGRVGGHYGGSAVSRPAG